MVNFLINKFKFFHYLLNHPLNHGKRFSAVVRYLRWQIGSRLVPGMVAVPFVGESRLLIAPGMTGATGNIYVGLHEYEDMAFVLHFLREGDLFVDVGANVGSYSVLAAKVCGSRVIAIEPIPSTFQRLLDNIHLNAIDAMVRAYNIGISDTDGELLFSSALDTVNHVIKGEEVENKEALIVPVKSLDHILEKQRPIMIKVDVEGFETKVVDGARSILEEDYPLVVIMELNGSGDRYGFDEDLLHRQMISYGFESYKYIPSERKLISLGGKRNTMSGNTIYIRHIDQAQSRVRDAGKFYIHNAKTWL